MSSETSELPEPGSSTMQKWWLLVVTDSLLQGTEVPICLRRCAGISGLGYYGEAAKACPVLILLPPPPLLFHVGINNTARGDPGHTKCDFVALDAMAISMGAKATARPLSIIFERSWWLGEVPAEWKKETPVSKEEKLGNCRPVILTLILWKVTEQIFPETISKHTKNWKVNGSSH